METIIIITMKMSYKMNTRSLEMKELIRMETKVAMKMWINMKINKKMETSLVKMKNGNKCMEKVVRKYKIVLYKQLLLLKYLQLRSQTNKIIVLQIYIIILAIHQHKEQVTIV